MPAPDFLSIGANSGLIPGTPGYDEAIGVAVEHCLWAAGAGLSPLAVMLPLYDKLQWRIPADPSWDQAIWHVAAAYHALPQPFTKRIKITRGAHEQDTVAASVAVDGRGVRAVLARRKAALARVA